MNKPKNKEKLNTMSASERGLVVDADHDAHGDYDSPFGTVTEEGEQKNTDNCPSK